MKRAVLAVLLLALHARAEDLPAGALARLGTLRLRHGDEVLSVAFTPDSKRLVSTAHDGTLRFWDAANGEALGGFDVHRDEAIAWIASEKIALAGECSARLLATDGTQEAAFARDTLVVLAVSPDGTRVLGGDRKGSARTFDLATGVKEEILARHGEAVTAVAFSADGKLAASASRDEHVQLLAAGKATIWKNRLAHGLVFSPDSKWLAVVTWGALLLIDTASGSVERAIEAEKLEACAFSPDSTRVALAHGKSAGVHDVASGELVLSLEGHRANVTCAAFSPDGARIATGDRDGTLSLWDARTGKELDLPRHRSRVASVAWSPDGKTIATAEPSALHFWRGSKHASLDLEALAIAFAADGRLRVACGDGRIRGVDVVDATIEEKIDASGLPVDAIACATSGTAFVTGSRDGIVRLWDDETASREVDAGSWVTAVALAGDRVFAAGADRTVRSWRWSSARLLGALEGHERPVSAIATSPDGTLVATLGAERIVRVFAAATREKVVTLPGKAFTAIALGPRLAAGCADGAVRIFSIEGKEERVLRGHVQGITCLAWSPDGKRLVSGSRDGTALIWKLE